MQVMPPMISARTIQREYRRVFDEVKSKKQPTIITTNNRPDVAIVSLDMLEKMVTQAEQNRRAQFDSQDLSVQLSNVAELNDSLDELAAEFTGDVPSVEEIDRIYRKRMVEKHGRYIPRR